MTRDQLLQGTGAAIVALLLIGAVTGCNQSKASSPTSADVKQGMLKPNDSKDINDVPAAQRDMVRAIVEGQQKGQAPDINKAGAAQASPAAPK